MQNYVERRERDEGRAPKSRLNRESSTREARRQQRKAER